MMIYWLIPTFGLGILSVFLYLTKIRLQKRLNVVESILTEQQQKIEGDEERKQWKEQTLLQFKKAFEEVETILNQKLQAISKDLIGKVNYNETEFTKLLDEEFKKACEQIKFTEIEYKRTITKKRREFNRKNSKNAKPQQIYRSIYDEDNK